MTPTIYDVLAAYENGQEIFRRQSMAAVVGRIKELEAANADLLEKCEGAVHALVTTQTNWYEPGLFEAYEILKLAIAKAKGGKDDA